MFRKRTTGNIENRIRLKSGKFTRKKAQEKKIKALASMALAKKTLALPNPVTNDTTSNNVCDGRRIVDVAELENLKCNSCNKTLDLQKIIDEKRSGLHSVFIIRCEECNVNNSVATGKMDQDNHKYSHTNMKVVFDKLFLFFL